jgi:hypothetical protein
MDLDQAADLPSPAVPEHADSLMEPTDAAFDDWVLQDVVLNEQL